MNNQLNHRQLWAWLGVALVAPFVTVLSRESWLIVAVTACVCAILWVTVYQYTDAMNGKWFSLLQWGWATMSLSYLLSSVPLTWPQAQNDDLIMGLILILAVWATWRGTQACSRIGATLCWVVALLMIGVLLIGVKDIRITNLTPETSLPDPEALFILLIPCISLFLPRQNKRFPKSLAAFIVLFALAVPMVTAGVLSPELVKKVDIPFHELSKTLNAWNVAQRFDALICAGLTVSWFLLLILLLCVCGEMGGKINNKLRRPGIIASAVFAAAINYWKIRFSAGVMAVGSVVMWSMVPIVLQTFKNLSKK